VISVFVFDIAETL